MIYKTSFFNFFRKLLILFPGIRILRIISKKKSPNHFLCKFIPPNYLFKNNQYKTIILDGIKYNLDLSKVVDHYIYFGFADKGFTIFLSKLKSDFTIFDIGANIGITALPFSKRAKKVFAFEPSKNNFTRLKELIELNYISNIFPYNKGFGEKEETVLLEMVDSSNPGMNRIRDYKPDLLKCETIEIFTIDDFVRLNKLEKIDAIKIDVEGYEMKVIQGAIITLRKFYPILFIELDDGNLKEQGNSAHELIRLLYELGYKSIVKAETGEIVNVAICFKNCHYDIIVT